MTNGQIAIVASYLAEVKPLIRHLKLNKLNDNIYINEDFIIAVSGQGIIHAASSIGSLFSNYSNIRALINFGCGGGTDEVGTFTLIDAIRFFNKVDYLPTPFRHTFKKQHLETKLDESFDYKQGVIFDMEGWGVIQAAKKHLEKDYLFIAKVISDNSSTIFNKSSVNKMIEDNLSNIDTLIKKIKKIILPKPTHLKETLNNYARQFHISTYQRHELCNLLERLLVLEITPPQIC